MRGSAGAGAGRPQGQGQAFRPIDIVLLCVMGALLLVMAVEYSKSSAAERKAASAAADARAVSERLDEIRNTLSAINKDLSDMRLAGAEVPAVKRRLDALESRPAPAPEISPAELNAAVDAALERRRDAFTVDMERRGEAMAAEIAKRVDLDGVGGNLRRTADNFREGLDEGKKPERTERQKKADDNIAKGFDAAAEGLELFRKMQAGEITREEFQQKRRELGEKMRKQYEQLTPEEREAIRDRFGGWGGRRPGHEGGGGGEGAGEGEGGDEKF